MAKSLRSAIIQIQTYAKSCGVESAPDDPIDSNTIFPFSIAYADGPNTIIGQAKSDRKDIITIFLDVHFALQMLPENVQQAISFYDDFPDYIINYPTLNDTVDTVVLDDGIKCEFGSMEYAGTKTIGWRFSIPVKIRSIPEV